MKTNERIQRIIDKIDGATTLERKLRILSMEFYGWRVSVTAGSWEHGEIRITETGDTCFMGDPRMIQININDLDHIAELIEVLGDINYRVIEAAKKACLDERLDSTGFRFLKPMDWETCIKRWTKLHVWIKKWFPKYPNVGWDWNPAVPKNFINWAVRTCLGNIKPSRIFLDNIDKGIIEIQENGISNWKQGSGYWSEYCFRTDEEIRQSFGWGGQMSIAIQRVFSTKEESPIGEYNKVPEQWEVDSHYFQRVIEPKGRKNKNK